MRINGQDLIDGSVINMSKGKTPGTVVTVISVIGETIIPGPMHIAIVTCDMPIKGRPDGNYKNECIKF